jgi:hypothetical protein
VFWWCVKCSVAKNSYVAQNSFLCHIQITDLFHPIWVFLRTVIWVTCSWCSSLEGRDQVSRAYKTSNRLFFLLFFFSYIKIRQNLGPFAVSLHGRPTFWRPFPFPLSSRVIEPEKVFEIFGLAPKGEECRKSIDVIHIYKITVINNQFTF